MRHSLTGLVLALAATATPAAAQDVWDDAGGIETAATYEAAAIAAPDATWLVEPTPHVEQLFVADIHHARVREERQNFDVPGHYGRPDVLQLRVNRERQSTIVFE